MFDSLKEWLITFADKSFWGFDKTIDEVISLLKGDAAYWDDIVNIADKFKGFCYVIVGICLLIEIIQIASRVDMLKWEHGLKIGIKMVLTRVCIDQSTTFLLACYLQAQKWMEEFAIGGNLFEPLVDTLVMIKLKFSINSINGMGNILGLFTSCLLIFLAINICGIVVQMIAYGRMFEIYSYLVISPLPFAFLPLGTGDGFSINPITSNFIKNYIAACVQGVMMIGGIYIYKKMFGTKILFEKLLSLVKPNNMETVMDMGFAMLLNAVILVLIISKSSNIAKSMINAM